jgi:CRP-like cAMP-binding protein
MHDPLRQNRLLALLPAAELDAMRPYLERVTVQLGEPLIRPHEPIRYAYFPLDCLASLVIILEDGSTVESGSVGREGMVGIPIVLGAGSTPMQTLTQIAGDAFRIEASTIRAMFEQRGALHLMLSRYIHTLFMIASQSAACNRRHGVEARLARWLLMSSDSIASTSLDITQEFLAAMLGVRRAGVTEAAVKLQEAGWIAYSRGFVKILDREALEDAACECYHVVKQEYERLFGSLQSVAS